MDFFLNCDGNSVLLSTATTSNVDDLYHEVESRTGLDRKDTRLLLGGLQIRCPNGSVSTTDNSKSELLKEMGVQHGSTISVLLRVRGGMPATAPRIKMPANNRMHSSAALRTTDMWSNVIGDEFGKSNDVAQNVIAGKGGNTYEMAQNLMTLARLSGAAKGDAKRGSCKKCGEIGHLAFQCFNMLTTKKLQAGDISSTSSESGAESETSTVSSTSSEGSSRRRRRSPPRHSSASVVAPPSRPREGEPAAKRARREDDKEERRREKKERKKDKKHKKDKKKHKSKKDKKSSKDKKSKKDRD